MIFDEQILARLSNGLVYSAIAVYALAMLAYAAETAGRMAGARVEAAGVAGARVAGTGTAVTDAPSRIRLLGAVGTSLTVLAFLLNLGGVITRGLAAGRVPWGNMYEFVLVCALAAGAAYLAFLSRRPVRAFGVWIVAIVLLALGLAVTVLYAPAGELVPVLDSYWLVIHVAAAITGGGVFTVGAVATALFLVRHRQERRGTAQAPRGRYAASLPSTRTLEQVAHTAHIFAFPIWTFAVMAGAIWAENAWGRYWGWDPKETWAFITWVFYAAHLHAQATAGWRGVRASWFALAGYAAFLFNFFGVNLWISGLHSYAGV
ncbi:MULTISPECIES: c-type cytochrome biogenesis protein CcsB [unclassified Nocardioides]|uniref:c-type cytochrome biogenesis protein CcsB n=1 Tax=unclassified Nocardioides TaxID=2615069 RepID=UPI0009F0FA9B|nr:MULTISPECIES: c-type cytochrome biogenesis protein CcsB [unclassified Nocardioides]GAW49734.1 cytochrome c assembly protein [Nocardioides sp. PD653-B2]GAW56526.1 cytochrome c assembly protein [Nocardioides sp. PD653]